MRKKLLVFVLGLLLAGLAANAGAAWSPQFTNYTADMVIASQHGTMNSKVFFNTQKMRMEMNAEGHQSIMITRFDKKLAWMCMPEQKMCMEMGLNGQKQDIQSKINDPDVQVDRQFLGNESVDGHPTKKYHVVITRKGKKEGSGFIWAATDLKEFPVKYQDEEKTSTILWKNISFKAASDSMFEMPQGYKKMDMQGMMNGMGRRRN